MKRCGAQLVGAATGCGGKKCGRFWKLAGAVGAQVELLASAPQPLMKRADFSDLIRGILRRTFGGDLADQLGIPVSSAAPFLVMIALAISEARRWQTFIPGSAAQALQENTARRSAGRSPDIPARPTSSTHAPAP
jgi:hypothetical protein